MNRFLYAEANPATFIGKGKATEIADIVKEKA